MNDPLDAPRTLDGEPTQMKLAYASPKLKEFGLLHHQTQGTGGNGNDGAGVRTKQSDRMTKENIVRIGDRPLGIGLYLFDYRPRIPRRVGPRPPVRRDGRRSRDREAGSRVRPREWIQGRRLRAAGDRSDASLRRASHRRVPDARRAPRLCLRREAPRAYRGGGHAHAEVGRSSR